MKFLELQKTIPQNVFTFLDVVKFFPADSPQLIKTQLSRFAERGLICQIKRELYCFDAEKVDELVLANKLYQPSYVSLETALNYYGVIPDVPQSVTSVTVVTSKRIATEMGNFYYSKINQALFFGWSSVATEDAQYFKIALPEKALLDYFYIRRVKTAHDLRLNLKEFNMILYQKMVREYPEWVQGITL